MSGYDIYEIIVAIAIPLIATYVYAIMKTHHLRVAADRILYYFSSNMYSLDYYREEQKHLDNNRSLNYNQLIEGRDKWYLFFSGKKTVEKGIELYETALEFTKECAVLLNEEHYFSHSEYTPIAEKEAQLRDMIKESTNLAYIDYVTKDLKQPDFFASTSMSDTDKYGIPRSFIDCTFEKLRDTHNKHFVKTQLEKHKYFFDTVLKYPLDPQQRESIVKLEDNCLVISSAGSGKTSTSIAKVKYLLEKRRMKREEVLVVSYNRKTADEFEERLNVPGLTCKTFHALALSIIGEAWKSCICNYSVLQKESLPADDSDS